jgi:hypothetical protein
MEDLGIGSTQLSPAAATHTKCLSCDRSVFVDNQTMHSYSQPAIASPENDRPSTVPVLHMHADADVRDITDEAAGYLPRLQDGQIAWQYSGRALPQTAAAFSERVRVSAGGGLKPKRHRARGSV